MRAQLASCLGKARAALSGVCLFASTTLFLRGICFSTTEAMGVTAKIGLSIACTLDRFALVCGRRQRFPNWTLRFEVTVDVIWLLGKEFGDRVSDPQIAVALRQRIEIATTVGGQVACGWLSGATVEIVDFIGLEDVWITSGVGEG